MAKTVKDMFKEAIEEAFSCMQAVDDPEKKGNLAANIALALANSGAISVDSGDKDTGTKEDVKKASPKKKAAPKTEPELEKPSKKGSEDEESATTTVMKSARTVREQVNDDQVWTDEKKAELADEIEFLTMLQNDEENHEALKQCVAQLTSGIYEDFSFDMPPATVKELFNYIQSMMED